MLGADKPLLHQDINISFRTTYVCREEMSYGSTYLCGYKSTIKNFIDRLAHVNTCSNTQQS